MRLLVVMPALPDNGTTRVVLGLVERWVRSGEAACVFVFTPGVLGSVVPPGLVHYATSGRGRLRWRLPVVVVKLIRAARRATVVISGEEIGVGLLLSWLVALVTRRPLVIVVHSVPAAAMRDWVSPRLWGVTTRAYRNARLLVCVSQDLLEHTHALGVEPSRCAVIPNGIDVTALRWRAQLPPEIQVGSARLVVAVGRLVHQKGFDLLVEAHAQALADMEHRLVILGEGEARGDIEQLVARRGLAGSVSLPGHVANPAAVLARADLFVLSSRYEGLPLTLLEALALGVPTVSTDCPTGPREVLDGGRYGRLVPVESPAALARAIADHLRDPRELQVKAQDAYRDAARFDADAAAGDYLAALRALHPVRLRGAPAARA